MAFHGSWEENKWRYINPITSPLSIWNWGRYNDDNGGGNGGENGDGDGWLPPDVEEGISAVKWVAIALIVGLLLVYFGALPKAILGKAAKSI